MPNGEIFLYIRMLHLLEVALPVRVEGKKSVMPPPGVLREEREGSNIVKAKDPLC
jgi:hypothetical protein